MKKSAISIQDSNEELETNTEAILSKFRSIENFNLDKTEQFLIDSLNTESNVCLICIENLGVKDPIWNCSGCYAQFHINCIQSWIKDGSYQNVKDEINKNIPWHCPKCRKEYPQSSYPSIYYCYCGKEKNPKYDPWSIPHSCNQKCEKLKLCGHMCLILCHPGPCPPCPIMVKATCYCEKSSAVSRRCSNRNWSCNKPCNRKLGCKQHMCQLICHASECGECPQTSIQYCKCKKNQKEVLCKNNIWQCEEPCGKMYSCGNHKCDKICHEDGSCGKCPRSMKRTCPCGKSKSQKPCTEEIPTCGDTCEKLLDCGIHKCPRGCHHGSCDNCRQLILKRCRCGAREKELACYVEFICEMKCTKLRSCGKHKCNKKCCDGQCTPCEQFCNKLLSCKIHKCNMLCHQGQCYPCPLVIELFCPCGLSSVKVPCGKNKTNIKIQCKNQCRRPPKCHHKETIPHRCHASDCPPCTIKCEKQLNCGHFCQSKCHSAVLSEISNIKERQGPWDPLRVERKIVNLDCPPCKHPVKIECFGKHEIGEFACHETRPYSCGSKCGQTLKCSKHKCEFLCHKVDHNCEECERPCEEKRPEGCIHECPNGFCHKDECRPCASLLKFRCNCDKNTIHVECNKWTNANKQEKETLKSCRVPCTKNKTCGHSCDKLCHLGPCNKQDQCEAKITIKCICKTLKKSFTCKQTLQMTKEQLILECNEKCKQKSKIINEPIEDKKDSDKLTIPNQTTKSHTNYTILITSFSILLISIVIYLYSFI